MNTKAAQILRKLGIGVSILGLALVVGISSGAAKTKPRIGVPIYHPESKSYFELVEIQTRQYSSRGSMTANWGTVRKLAAQRRYKGVRGQLAIVDSPEIHDFLRLNLQPDRQAWIGLRYWCQFRKLQWVNGEVMSRRDFHAWHHRWDQTGDDGGCKGDRGGYTPVAYTGSDGGFRWVAKGIAKAYHYYYVQYPTGEE